MPTCIRDSPTSITGAWEGRKRLVYPSKLFPIRTLTGASGDPLACCGFALTRPSGCPSGYPVLAALIAGQPDAGIIQRRKRGPLGQIRDDNRMLWVTGIMECRTIGSSVMRPVDMQMALQRNQGSSKIGFSILLFHRSTIPLFHRFIMANTACLGYDQSLAP